MVEMEILVHLALLALMDLLELKVIEVREEKTDPKGHLVKLD
jgi:hypothetical protein